MGIRLDTQPVAKEPSEAHQLIRVPNPEGSRVSAYKKVITIHDTTYHHPRNQQELHVWVHTKMPIAIRQVVSMSGEGGYIKQKGRVRTMENGKTSPYLRGQVPCSQSVILGVSWV